MNTIEKIHNEFSLCSDVLLEKAESLIQKGSKEFKKYESLIDKSNRLKKLGFTNCKDVIYKRDRIDKLEKQLIDNKELTELILYYKQTYPFQKFLPESELERICEKYNLIYAPVDNYIKTVPEKNLKEIENARLLKIEDNVNDKFRYEFIFFSGVPEKARKWFRNLVTEYQFFTDNQFKKLCPIKFSGYVYTSLKTIKIDKISLFIAAPKSHFNLKGLKKSKNGFFKIIKTEAPDPIVFRYCRGGVQILTMWGDENFDPNKEFGLINEIRN